jgi:hypothetical protein
MSPDTVLRLRRDVRFRLVAGEAVILRQEAAEVMGLNAVGSRLLALVDGSRSLSAMVDVLESEFDAPRERLESDALGFARELVEAGVLEPA